MIINTELNIQDDVFFLEDNKFIKGLIVGINIEITPNKFGNPVSEIIYVVKSSRNSFTKFTLDEISRTPEELFEKIKKKSSL